MLKIFEFLFLAFIQGVTEPIPVSSSGHILIVKTIFENIFNDIHINYTVFATITNFGSLIAIIILFWSDIIKLVQDFFGYIKTKDQKLKNNFNYCWWIVIGTIPAGLLGLIASKFELLEKIEENFKVVGAALIITGIFLYIVRRFVGKRNKDQMTIWDAVVVGFCQVLALIPGISRSGSTLIGGMFRGLDRETAFKYSFMLYIPISIATTILGIKELFELNASKEDLFLYLVAFQLAGVITYYATKIFRKIVSEGKLIYFVIYCFIIGSLVILFL